MNPPGKHIPNLLGASDVGEAVILNDLEEFEASDKYGRVDLEDLYDEENLPESARETYDYLADRGIAVSLRRETAIRSKKSPV